MLKLRKVELLGFKSFCEKTPITFSGSGITCIVGPNGCGKSNVVDAISWVLGEQSHKMLRAERMSDCIFNGTAKRPPMGISEVTLTLVDPGAIRSRRQGDRRRAGGCRQGAGIDGDPSSALVADTRAARPDTATEPDSRSLGETASSRSLEKTRRRKACRHYYAPAKSSSAAACIAPARANI